MFPRWLLGALVLASWLGAMAWRVERDMLPRWRESARASYRTVLEGRFPWRERYRISVQGRPVGEVVSEARREPDGSIALKEAARLDPRALREALPRFGVLLSLVPGAALPEEGKPFVFGLKLSLSSEYRLQGFELSGSLGSLPIRGSGVVRPDGLAGVISAGGVGREASYPFTLPVDPARPLAMGLSPLGAVPDLPVGRSWDIQVLNPMTSGTETLRARVAAVEEVEAAGRTWRARRIEIEHAMLQATAWVDDDGRLLRQRFLGFEMERLPPGTAP